MRSKPRRTSTNHGRRAQSVGIRSSETRLFGGALAAVFVLKLVVMLQLKDHVLTQPDAGLDTTAYVGLAERVLGGDPGLGPGLYFLSPLYVYFLSLLLAVSHSFTFVRLVQIVLGTGAVVCIFVTADEWFGRRAAWIAGALATLTGVFTFYESLILQTALDPFFTAAALACLTIALKREDRRWSALAGLTFGIQVSNRPNVALPALAIALLLAATRRWQAAAAFSIAAALALVPITLRNIVVSGDWSPVTASHGGLNFYIGNNADADGSYGAIPGVTPDVKGQQEDTRRVAERATGHALDDAGVSSYFYGLGWTWVREQPMAAARLLARKIALVFSAKYLWLNYSYPFFAYDEHTLLRAMVVGPWLLIPLGLVGLVGFLGALKRALPETRSAYLIWASFVPIYAIAVAAFYVSDRYQLPILVPLCAGAGAALDAVAVAVAERRWRSLLVPGAVIVALLIAVNHPRGVDEGVGEERTRMAERLVTLGRVDDAEGWADRAASASLQPGVVHFRLGQRLVVANQPAAAIAHFQKALAADPNQPVVEYALGETLLEAERPGEAIAPLRRAFEAGVHVDEAGIDLVRALGAAGERDEAIRVLEQLRPAGENDAERSAALAGLAVQLQEPRLAEAFSRNALATRPGFAAAHALLGASFNLAGRFADARRELEEAIRLDPRDAASHVSLAVAEANLGRLEEARAQIEEALRLDPRSAQANRVRQALDAAAADVQSGHGTKR
ncbi:MAG TPA: tetratricopeptide repeat protein [Vicinamibacterales bacterium]|nr:tetratricopeptide repeat protein [Vicinamibacterales bacterium]